MIEMFGEFDFAARQAWNVEMIMRVCCTIGWAIVHPLDLDV